MDLPEEFRRIRRPSLVFGRPPPCTLPAQVNCLPEVRISLGLEKGGLSLFQVPTDGTMAPEGASQPLNWVHGTICMDMGSDGFAGMNYAQRVLNLSIEQLHDPSHGSWRDFQRMLREGGMMCYWLLLMVVMNMVHGPWLEDSRFNTQQEAMKEIWGSFSHFRCALFVEYSRAMRSLRRGSQRTSATRR